MPAKQSIKIIKLIVRNYRAIGAAGLEIDIDNIVILVGPNNSGKSTILKALHLVTSTDTRIKLDDFYKSEPTNQPEIEVWSKVIDADAVNIDKEKWLNPEGVVKEKWQWTKPDDAATRIGFRVDYSRWAIATDSPQAPFAGDGAASAYRPYPTYISPFEQPEKQVEEIKKIISSDIYESIKKIKKEDKVYQDLQKGIKQLQDEIKTEAEAKESELATNLGGILNELFGRTNITLHVPQSNPDLLSSYAGPKDIDFKIDNLSLDNQGSGMQRALLWSVLKMLSGRQKVATVKAKKSATKKDKPETQDSESIPSERTKILLMDEPEICLHPESIRQAKEILYGLSLGGEWQIMITTHSPIFIDLSKDNTNIIRVQKEEEKVSLFRTDDAGLSASEKDQVKMLNIFDPYFAEFFFAKNIIVVEGDTEYTAFRKIIEMNKEKYKDIHIIRARGKYTIVPIIKILKKWGKDFAILHDSDLEDNRQAWPANEQILQSTITETSQKIRLLACKNNFESAFLGGSVSKDKPYNAYKKIEDTHILNKISYLLDFLCNSDASLHIDIKTCVCEYKTIDELKTFIQ